MQGMNMAFCGNCGKENPESNRFCYSCGAEISKPVQEPHDGYVPTMDNGVERIGSYNPNVHYAQPPAVQYQPQPYQPYGQPYQQYPPQYQTYQPYPNQPYMPPFQPYTNNMDYGRNLEPVYLNGAPNNRKNLRFIAIGLSLATLVLVMVALLAVPMSTTGKSLLFASFDYMEVLLFVMLALIFAFVGVIVPMFSTITGVCLIGSSMLLVAKGIPMDGSIFIVIVLAIVAAIIGLISSACMKGYARANVRNVTTLQYNLYTWTGIRMPDDTDQQFQRQYRY